MRVTTEQLEAAVAEVQRAVPHNDRYDVTGSPVGSAYTVGEGNDIDVLLLVEREDGDDQAIEDVMRALDEAGFSYTGDPSGDEDEFRTLRRGDINVIVTDEVDFFVRFMRAAEVCKFLGLRQKWERIGVHRILMNDEDAGEQVRL
jgi:hypothetical protein